MLYTVEGRAVLEPIEFRVEADSTHEALEKAQAALWKSFRLSAAVRVVNFWITAKVEDVVLED